MKILLNACCVPCLIYPLEKLKDAGFKARAFYYNPNIHPLEEYNRRKEALDFLSKELNLEVEYPQYQVSDFFQAINGRKEPPERCVSCWSLRLQKTARQAREGGFDAFSSTLLVSPYQDHELLKQIRGRVAKEAVVDFFYEDFRTGFKQANQ